MQGLRPLYVVWFGRRRCTEYFNSPLATKKCLLAILVLSIVKPCEYPTIPIGCSETHDELRNSWKRDKVLESIQSMISKFQNLEFSLSKGRSLRSREEFQILFILVKAIDIILVTLLFSPFLDYCAKHRAPFIYFFDGRAPSRHKQSFFIQQLP